MAYKRRIGKRLVRRFSFVLMVFFLFSSFALMAAAAEKKPEFTWRVQTVHAPAEATKLVRVILNDIEVASGGRMKFELFSSGELMPDDQMLPAVLKGTVEMIHTIAANDAAPVDISPLDCWPPFQWEGPLEILNMYYNRGMKEIYNKAFEELGPVKVLGVSTTDPLHLLSTRPIYKYEDLKGLKISTDKIVAKPFLDAGAVAVSVPVSEFYLSGKTGIVDALAWCGAKEAVANSWYEVYPYFLTNRIAGCTLTRWMANKRAFENLPKDLQDLMEMGIRNGALKAILYYYDDEPKNRRHFKMTTMPKEDWAKIQASMDKHLDEVAKTSDRVAKLIKIYRDYNKEVEELGWYRCK